MIVFAITVVDSIKGPTSAYPLSVYTNLKGAKEAAKNDRSNFAQTEGYPINPIKWHDNKHSSYCRLWDKGKGGNVKWMVTAVNLRD